jgi:hypothetical protein
VAARLLQVVVFPYRVCFFTAVTRVQIPSGTPTIPITSDHAVATEWFYHPFTKILFTAC